jgi:membrane protease YdiL (CAAX protease family)
MHGTDDGTPCRLVLQAVFFAVYMAATPAPVPFSLADLPWYTYAIGLAWVLAILPVNEAAKAMDARRYVRLQKRSRLLFGTKLGMHSPV